MHVGAVVAEFDPRSGGGYTFEREVLGALIEKAPASSHRFTIICPPAAVDNVRRAVAGSGIDVASVKRGSRIGNMLMRELEFARAHWRKPSALDRLAAEQGIQFIWFLSAQQARTNVPYMTVVWDLQHRATPWFPEMSALGKWDSREAAHRAFLQRATRIVTGTKVGREQLRDFYQIPDENILTLPHPTPTYVANENASDGDVASRLGLHEPFVFYPAQFWPHKNHANLVLAISLLRKQGLNVHLALTGSDHGNRKFVADLVASEGVGDLVKVLGFVDRADLVSLYRRALALTFVSWCGPENLPPLEAFALGCPVIASRIPGADEQLGDAALFCEPGDPQSIADAIAKLLNNPPLRTQMIELGRIRGTRFTPQDYVSGVFENLSRFEPVRRCWP